MQAQIRAWEERSFTSIPIHINLSAKNFDKNSTIVHIVDNALSMHQLSSSQLRVEVTESALLENFENAHSILTQLQLLGVKIELDDFGTGFSSLNYLHKLPFNGLKIDRSFVGTLSADPGSGKIVRMIISLARDLNLEVIAEGVETDYQVERL